MQVWVYPEKTREEFGSVRWECEWQEVKPSATARIAKAEAAGELDEYDRDRDLLWRYSYHKTKQAALAAAKTTLKTRREFLAFGHIVISKQVVDWFVEEDRVAEWSDVGEPEYVD